MELSRSVSDEVLATARALATDVVCAEVVEAWQREGIDSILLKGLTAAEWLYPDAARAYVDADLLVAPDSVLAAAAVLDRLGFTPIDHHVSLHAHPWMREADNAEIDLHVTLWGPHCPPQRVWNELRRCTEAHAIGRTRVSVLKLPGRALHVALHAAQHVEQEKPRRDLLRAIERAGDDVWREAERLGDRIRALPAMIAGLTLVPEGNELLRRLPLASAAQVAEREHAPLALGFTRFAIAEGGRERLRVVARALVPPRDALGLDRGDARSAWPAALAAYGGHWISLVVRAPRTVRAIRRLRRDQQRARRASG